MDPKDKLAIFEKYDFSKTGLLEKAALDRNHPNIELYHDIAGMVQALSLKLAEVAGGVAETVGAYDALQNEVYTCYGWLQLRYHGVAWDELDPADPDFDALFKMKEAIDALGRNVNAFLDEVRPTMGGGADSEPYFAAQDQIQKIGILMQKYLLIKKQIFGED